MCCRCCFCCRTDSTGCPGTNLSIYLSFVMSLQAMLLGCPASKIMHITLEGTYVCMKELLTVLHLLGPILCSGHPKSISRRSITSLGNTLKMPSCLRHGCCQSCQLQLSLASLRHHISANCKQSQVQDINGSPIDEAHRENNDGAAAGHPGTGQMQPASSSTLSWQTSRTLRSLPWQPLSMDPSIAYLPRWGALCKQTCPSWPSRMAIDQHLYVKNC